MVSKGKGEEEECKKQARPTNIEVMRRERSYSTKGVAEMWQRKRKKRWKKEEREEIFKKSAIIVRSPKKRGGG